MGSSNRLCDLFKHALAFASGAGEFAQALQFDASADLASSTVTAIGEAIGEALASVRSAKPVPPRIVRELRIQTGHTLPRAIDAALGRTLAVLESGPSAADLDELARDIEAAMVNA